MMSVETNAHSFIVRLWTEEALAGSERTLGGHITDAYSKRRAPVVELADILQFIEPYTATMGVKLSGRTRLILAINRLGRHRHGAQNAGALE